MAEQLAPVEVIERTRRGEPVDAASAEAFVRSWIDRTTSDALMASWCMAACLVGIDAEQAGALTRGLIASGDRLELSSIGPAGDLHSTGGVGDTSPIAAAPLAASLGVKVATTGIRGLGHAGGIIDKLESIPGFEAELALARFVRQVRDVGIAVAAPSARITPAERRLAGLRDATATTASAGLVAASVMSRAIAGGAGAVALDVTFGDGAYIAGAEEAERTARLMAGLARPWGRRVRWVVSDMGHPRGRMVGNALEVAEAAEVLRGEGPADVRDLAVRMAGDLAEAAGVVPAGQGRAEAARALDDGRALASAEAWIEAQDGDPGVWTDPEVLPSAPVRREVAAPRDGWLAAAPARAVGEIARWLGAGRLHPDQSIDPVAGVELPVAVGGRVAAGEPVAVIHARDEWAADRAREMAEGCLVVSPDPVAPAPVVVAEGGDDAGAA